MTLGGLSPQTYTRCHMPHIRKSSDKAKHLAAAKAIDKAPALKAATPRIKTAKDNPASTGGAAGVKSRKVADAYAAGTRKVPDETFELEPDVTPLDVMLMAMHRAYVIGGSILAAEYAEKAAPYIHGKISSIELKNPMQSAPAKEGETASGDGRIAFKVEFVDAAKE